MKPTRRPAAARAQNPALAPTEPDTARGLTAGAGDGKVSLDWSPGADSSRFNIYRRTAGGQWGAALATTTADHFVDTAVANATVYGYRVTAVDAAGQESAPTPEVVAVPTAGERTPSAANSYSYITFTR